ncbi:MAG TPA: SufS family cysteine desulfurase [Gemmataceae bacterium]|nr:SufS family cysteine desulfurase [Gemmataceae bacterium]
MSIHPVRAASPVSRGADAAPLAFDVMRVREDFPILSREVHGQPLVYFDNAATTQKPQAVLDAIQHYYSHDNANIHRAVHLLSQRATRAYEEARQKVCRYLGAAEPREIIFTRGATEGINLVSQSWGRSNLRAGDEIILSAMEHHSNIVPWQILCEQTGAVLRVVPISDDGEFLLNEYEKLLSDRTRLVCVVHVSNSLGTIAPVRRIIELAHARGALVLLDGAQSAPHLPIDVQELDCDFFVMSGHKVYGPTGIGALYGKASLLERMPPYQGGGDMIKTVTFAKTTYADLPARFEAGTPNIAGAIGLGAAVDYVESIGRERIAAHEELLLRYATERMRQIPGVRLIGNAPHKAAVISFVVDDPPLASLDIGTKLDLEGIAVRTGHHCCQPVMDRFGIPGTTRISFAMYNTTAEIDVFLDALRGLVADRSRPSAKPQAAEPTYPRAAADSPQAAAEELIEEFELFDDWVERYQYLIDRGEEIPPLPDVFRTEANRVRGCQSTVYLWARKKPGSADVIEFLADSDADLVRGLIALLERLYCGQRAEQILSFDVEGFFARLGLDQHLTLGRRNGLAAMVQRIRQLAATLAGRNP